MKTNLDAYETRAVTCWSGPWVPRPVTHDRRMIRLVGIGTIQGGLNHWIGLGAASFLSDRGLLRSASWADGAVDGVVLRLFRLALADMELAAGAGVDGVVKQLGAPAARQ